MLNERELTPMPSEHERVIDLAMRIGKLEAMLMWMATDGRLKPHEIRMLSEEFERNLYPSDKKNTELLNPML